MRLTRNRARRAVWSVAAAAAVAFVGLAFAPVSANADTIAADPNGHGTPTVDTPCGVDRRADAPARYQHVIWILMENETNTQVIGSPNTPFINKLAGQCGLATNYSAISHPSLPNYIALTSGGLQGVTDDANPSAHPLNVPNIFQQLGGDWRGLDESMKTNCEQTNDGRYAVRHNPAAYYTNISDQCAFKDVPLTANPNLSAKFTFVTPDVCDDMHDVCHGGGNADQLQTGDAFLATFVPELINSNQYLAGKTAIFLTWDEGGSGPNQVVTEVIAPTVTPGTVSAAPFNHFSLLHTTEELLGLPFIGQAATATSMRDAFGL
jgi:phosphatidylinositol-3-phosphatase